MKIISACDLYTRLQRGEAIRVIDVREAWEYEEENIGAINIPLYDLPRHLDRVRALADTPLVLHCKSGARSEKARKFLQSVGIKSCLSLENGMEDFKKLYGHLP